MRAHKLKTWKGPFFSSLFLDDKKHELRWAGDRDFRVGDCLCLIEWDADLEQATGRHLYRRISFITTAEDVPRGLLDGFVILSLDDCSLGDKDAMLGREGGIFRADVEWLKPKTEEAT